MTIFSNAASAELVQYESNSRENVLNIIFVYDVSDGVTYLI